MWPHRGQRCLAVSHRPLSPNTAGSSGMVCHPPPNWTWYGPWFMTWWTNEDTKTCSVTKGPNPRNLLRQVNTSSGVSWRIAWTIKSSAYRLGKNHSKAWPSSGKGQHDLWVANVRCYPRSNHNRNRPINMSKPWVLSKRLSKRKCTCRCSDMYTSCSSVPWTCPISNSQQFPKLVSSDTSSYMREMVSILRSAHAQFLTVRLS